MASFEPSGPPYIPPTVISRQTVSCSRRRVESSEPSGDLYKVSVVATGFPQMQYLINLFLVSNLPKSERALGPAHLENKMIILILI